MAEKVLITGGAGFIGSHLADELLEAGYEVRVLDNLSPQVHGDTKQPPEYLSRSVEFIRGDVRDADLLAAVLREVSCVGDIRHCFADISKARQLIGYEPQVSLEQGFVELAQWLSGQTAFDRVEQAHLELEKRGLTL